MKESPSTNLSKKLYRRTLSEWNSSYFEIRNCMSEETLLCTAGKRIDL